MALLLGGIVLAVCGGVTWGIAAGRVGFEQQVSAYGSAFSAGSGIAFGNPDLDVANAWMWVGIIATIIGVLLLLATVVVRATTRVARPVHS